jgi:diaminopimelate decarboxylase
VLCCEQRPLTELAERFGTPLYVYSASTIRSRFAAFQQAFEDVPHTICYSVKANSNLSVLRLLGKLGSGFDVVSAGELARVMKAAPRKVVQVVFSGVGKTADEMTAALRAGILIFNLESESEMRVLAECAARLKKRARVALRVNPNVAAETHPYISTGLHEHKFGVPIGEARRLYREAAAFQYLKVAGVSVHIGSQITDVAPFREAMERVAETVRELREDGHEITYVDAGGGLGISYREDGPDFERLIFAYAEALKAVLGGLGVHLLLEPGRSIIGAAGALVTRVLYRKTNGAKKFLIVDAAMNDLIRPSLYEAHHEISPVILGHGPVGRERTDVVGPICETGDFLALDREMPVMQEGELLAVRDAGAYGMVLASNYNTRLRPAEVMVEGKKARVIRRRERFEDVVRGEVG